MKTSTKVMIGVGALAVAGGIFFLWKKGKDIGVGTEDYTGGSTAPGFQLMTPVSVPTLSTPTWTRSTGKYTRDIFQRGKGVLAV